MPAEQARLHRPGVGNALQVEHVGAQRAHEHDGHDGHERAARQLHGHGPGLHGHRGRRASEEHGQPRHQKRPPLAQHAHRKERVERERHRRKQPPREPLRRDGQAPQVPLRGEREHAGQRAQKPGHLPHAGKAARPHAHVQHDEHEAHLFERRARGGVGVADGGEVAHLGEQYAEDREGRDLHDGAHVAEHGDQAPPVAHSRHEQEACRRDDHARARDPQRGHAVAVHEQLGACAGKAPAHAPCKRAGHATRHMSPRRRRHRFCHAFRPLSCSRRMPVKKCRSALSHVRTRR